MKNSRISVWMFIFAIAGAVAGLLAPRAVATTSVTMNFLARQTAKTHSTYGNLQDIAWNKGVDVSLAFWENILFPKTGCTGCDYNTWGNYWADRFYYYATSGYSIANAAINAKEDHYKKHGQYGGYDSWVIAGSSTITLTPARYGS